MGPDRVLREAEIPISTGYTLDRLIGLIKRILHSTGVMQVVMTPSAVHVARYVLPMESVVPPEALDQEMPPLDAFLSKPIEPLLQSENQPAFHNIQRACEVLHEQGFRPSLIIAPVDPSTLVNFFSFEGQEPPQHIIGIPVQYLLGPEYHEQLIVFGGSTYLFDDIEIGVSVDMGDV